ncbi:MAG: MFS transporter [Chloroflexia bacterium]
MGGLVFGVSPFIAGLLAPFWGTVADKYGRKPVFIRSLIAFVILMVLYGFVQNVQQLFALRVLHGVFGGFGAMAMSMISVSAPESRAGSAIGRLQAVMLLTNASGPLRAASREHDRDTQHVLRHDWPHGDRAPDGCLLLPRGQVELRRSRRQRSVRPSGRSCCCRSCCRWRGCSSSRSSWIAA